MSVSPIYDLICQKLTAIYLLQHLIFGV